MSEGRVKRLLHRLAVDDQALEAEQLRGSALGLGATPVRQCGLRQRVSVAGTLRAVTLRPRAGVPALEAELWDGSGTVRLVWLGRRRIPGVEPGRRLVADGRIADLDGRRAIFNPTYTFLLPEDC